MHYFRFDASNEKNPDGVRLQFFNIRLQPIMYNKNNNKQTFKHKYALQKAYVKWKISPAYKVIKCSVPVWLC